MPSRAARWISAIVLRSKVADSRSPGCQPLARMSLISVAPDVVDVEVVEPPRRAVAAELAASTSSIPARSSSSRDLLGVLRAHLLLDAVGAEPGDRRRARTAAPRTASRRAPRRRRRTRRSAPFWAMNALMCPTEPRTTMSTPFSEIPQRAEASPWITSRPPRAVAPADCARVALDDHRPRHHVLGHADAAVAVHARPWRACSCRRSSSRRGRRSRPRRSASSPTAIACLPPGFAPARAPGVPIRPHRAGAG